MSDADKAVAAARAASGAWSLSPAASRLAHLQALLDLYTANREVIACAMSREMGAQIDVDRSEQVDAGLVHFRETIRVLEAFEFERFTSKDRLLQSPIGAAVLITPWNWPMNQVMLKVAPALAADCTVVLNPSELARLSSMLLADLIDRAGFPPGVFNLVNGDGPGVGAHLSAHPDIDMVSFTVSTGAGAAISAAAAPTVKRVTLELGGKGANLIFEDAIEGAVEAGVLGCFSNSGQSCDAPTRMLVQRPCYEKAVRLALRVAEACDVAPADREGDHIGPLVSETHWRKVQGLIQTGIEEGARLVAGGPGRP